MNMTHTQRIKNTLGQLLMMVLYFVTGACMLLRSS